MENLQKSALHCNYFHWAFYKHNAANEKTFNLDSSTFLMQQKNVYASVNLRAIRIRLFFQKISIDESDLKFIQWITFSTVFCNSIFPVNSFKLVWCSDLTYNVLPSILFLANTYTTNWKMESNIKMNIEFACDTQVFSTVITFFCEISILVAKTIFIESLVSTVNRKKYVDCRSKKQFYSIN